MSARYVLAEASDRHVVWLRDVTDAPLVKKPYGSIEVVPATIKIVYERKRFGAPWDLCFLGVDGWRAKKDGTAGAQGADATWAYSSARDKEIPAWLAAIVEDFRPTVGVQVARYAPDFGVEPPKIFNSDWRIW